MAKKDHPVYGINDGKSNGQTSCEPHILPAVFEEGVYYLHQIVDGEHIVKKYRSRVTAEAALFVLKERMAKS